MSKITVHHLNNSRSQRILWLLEELGLEYDIKYYKRDPKTLLAPASLRQVHPLGKSPIMTDGTLTLAESGAIIDYLVEEYGQGRLIPPRGTPERLRYTYWLHYAEGSVMPPLFLKGIFDRIEQQPTPFFVKPNSRVRAGHTIYIPVGVSHGFSTPDEAIALLSVQSPSIYPEQSMPDIHFVNVNSFQENSMQPVPDQEQRTTEVFATHLALVGKDVQAWVNLFTEDAVVEYPYASTTPGRLEGKAAIYNYMKDVPAQVQNLMFSNVRVYPTSNPSVLFAEVHGEAVIVSTGRHYQQDYVMRLETKEGKIVHYREYWNPVPALEAWGGTQNLRQSFNADSVE